MAVVTKAELENAAVDVQTISDVVNTTDPSVTSRLGLPVKSLTQAIAEIGTYGDLVNWATATEFSFKDLARESGVIYICLEPHTSGVFADDVAANRWGIFQTATPNELDNYIAGLPVVDYDISSSIVSDTTLWLDDGVYFYTEINTPLSNFTMRSRENAILLPTSTIFKSEDFSYYSDTHKRVAYSGHIPEIIFDRNLNKCTISESPIFYYNQNFATGDTVTCSNYDSGSKTGLFDILCGSDVEDYVSGSILTNSFIRLNGWFSTRRYDFGFVTPTKIVGQQVYDFEIDQFISQSRLTYYHQVRGYGNKFKICNLLKDLDSESFVIKGGFLYVPNSMDGAIIPSSDRFISSSGNSNVSISGIHFVGSSFKENERTGSMMTNHQPSTYSMACMKFFNSDGISVMGCKFSMTERAAISTYEDLATMEQLLHGGHEASGNELIEVGTGGISLIGYDVKISKNKLRDCGIFDGSKPCLKTEGLLTEISDNTIDGVYSYGAMGNNTVDRTDPTTGIGYNILFLDYRTQPSDNLIVRNTFRNNGEARGKEMYAYNGDSAVIYQYYALGVRTNISSNSINRIDGYRQAGVMLDGFASDITMSGNIVYKSLDHALLVTPPTESQVADSVAIGQYIYHRIDIQNNLMCGPVYHQRLDITNSAINTGNVFTGNDFDFYDSRNMMVKSFYDDNLHLPFKEVGGEISVYKDISSETYDISETMLSNGFKIIPPDYIEYSEDQYLYYKYLESVVEGDIYLDSDGNRFKCLENVDSADILVVESTLLREGEVKSIEIINGNLKATLSRSWNEVEYLFEDNSPSNFSINFATYTDGLTILPNSSVGYIYKPKSTATVSTYNIDGNGSLGFMRGAEPLIIAVDVAGTSRVYGDISASALAEYWIAPCRLKFMA